MDSIITFYKERLKLQNTTFTRIDHDEGMVAIVYKIIVSVGSPLILKISPRDADYFRELYFLKHFARELVIPEIVEEIPPEEGIYGAIVMKYLPGNLLKIVDLTNKLASQLGSQLAKIHLNREAGYGDPIQSNLILNPSNYFAIKFDEEFEECSNHLPKKLLSQCLQYYDAHSHLLSSVDGPCLIHRDFRPGNVIVNKGKLEGIIDWASGRRGFAEEDFYPLEHKNWGDNPAIIKSFLAGYSDIRPIPEYKVIMPLLQIARALATIGFLIKQDTWANRHTYLYQAHRQFLDNFFKKPVKGKN